METPKGNEIKKTSGMEDIYFCPNGQHSETFTRKNLPAEKRTIIRQLHELDRRRNWIIPFHFLLWIGSGVIAIRSPWMWVDIVCICIGGVRLSGLAVLVHESSHLLFTRKKIDRWIGFLCGLPILLPANAYRVSHMMHHKFVRTEKDPDDLENLSSQARWLPFFYILMLFLGAYMYVFHIPISAWKVSKKNRWSILLETLSIWVMVIMGWALLPSEIMVQAWLFPLLFAAQILNVRGISEHGLTSTGNEFVDSRTILSNSVVSFLSCHVNYHLAHHLFPGIP